MQGVILVQVRTKEISNYLHSTRSFSFRMHTVLMEKYMMQLGIIWE